MPPMPSNPDLKRLAWRAHRRFVGGNDNCSRVLGVSGPRQVSREPWQEPGRHAGEGERLLGAKDALERFAHRATLM